MVFPGTSGSISTLKYDYSILELYKIYLIFNNILAFKESDPEKATFFCENYFAIEKIVTTFAVTIGIASGPYSNQTSNISHFTLQEYDF